MTLDTCKVCDGGNTGFLLKDQQGRTYHRCNTCEATWLDPAHYLDHADEFSHYHTHHNDVDDPGYRKYLSRLVEPLLNRLAPSSHGLDYGCGPGPALAAMMREAGHHMSLYDPFFAPDETVLKGTYDFITCTETVEHFHHPSDEFKKLAGVLKQGGILAIMTVFQTDDARFEAWQYRADPTHVSFYRERTFTVIAQQLDFRCEIICKDVAFLMRT